MLGSILLLVQSAAPSLPAPASGPVLDPPSPRVVNCDPDQTTDIVVCGRRRDNEQYRLRPLGDPPNGKPLPPATMRLGPATANMHAEQRSPFPGASAPALMATIKLPF